MMKKSNYLACILETESGELIYSAGTDRATLVQGLTDGDRYSIVECSDEAYRLICEGRWDELTSAGGDGYLCSYSGRGGQFVNGAAPVVRCIVEGRDY